MNIDNEQNKMADLDSESDGDIKNSQIDIFNHFQEQRSSTDPKWIKGSLHGFE